MCFLKSASKSLRPTKSLEINLLVEAVTLLVCILRFSRGFFLGKTWTKWKSSYIKQFIQYIHSSFYSNPEHFSRRCICGEMRQARIVCPAGENCTAGIGTLPWQAGLVFRGSWQPWCGASLISNSYLVNKQSKVFSDFLKKPILIWQHKFPNFRSLNVRTSFFFPVNRCSLCPQQADSKNWNNSVRSRLDNPAGLLQIIFLVLGNLIYLRNKKDQMFYK